MTWALPRSRGSQRQRSMLAMTVSTASVRRGAGATPLRLRIVPAPTKPSGLRPALFWYSLTAADERIVVVQVGLAALDPEPLAQQRDARVLRAGRMTPPSGMRMAGDSSGAAVPPRSSASLAFSAR